MANGWEALEEADINIPHYCKKCGGLMLFQGVGEYQCDKCGFYDYDDYGKVRNFIEKKPGASTVEIERVTGVNQRTIRKMLREGRFMLTVDSKVLLHCDNCRKPIRFGKLCEECEKAAQKQKEDLQKMQRRKNGLNGFGMGLHSQDEGQKRYDRKK